MGSSYRTLMANKVGAPTGIERVSPAFQADVLTTAPQRPSVNSTKIAPSHSTMDSHSGSVEGKFEVTGIELSKHCTFMCVG